MKKTLCKNCKTEYTGNHCPHCLCAVCTADFDGDPCFGTASPIAVWVKSGRDWDIVCRCNLCGSLASSAVTDEDNQLILTSIAAKPIAFPPFPLERLEEITRISGTVDEIGGGII